jgi:hypothetical protein
MLRAFSGCVSGLVACALLSTGALARNPDDYPLRVHIFEHNTHSHYYHRTLDTVDGEGRANLYENGEPRGFDYSYRCSERIRNSPGFETYLAKWKKRDQTLEILMPKLGKPGATESCDLHVEMKDIAYYKHGGTVDEEPASAFKQWMEKHQYDPEHGKNEPVKATPEQTGTDANAPQ